MRNPVPPSLINLQPKLQGVLTLNFTQYFLKCRDEQRTDFVVKGPQEGVLFWGGVGGSFNPKSFLREFWQIDSLHIGEKILHLVIYSLNNLGVS